MWSPTHGLANSGETVGTMIVAGARWSTGRSPGASAARLIARYPKGSLLGSSLALAGLATMDQGLDVTGAPPRVTHRRSELVSMS